MTVRAKFAAGATFGLWMGVSWFLLGILFPKMLYGGTPSISVVIFFAVFMAVFCGVLFPIGIEIFSRYQSRKFQADNETWLKTMEVLYSAGANHFMGIEGVGGYLVLTPDALLFKSHKFNIQNHTLEIPLEQCVNVTIVDYCYVIPTGINVETENGKNERFAVANRKAWIEKIQNAISMKKPTTE